MALPAFLHTNRKRGKAFKAIGQMDRKEEILAGKTYLGIEFGSTRIKAVLTGEDYQPIASGAHDWENRLEDGVWTYTLEDIWTGLQDCYSSLAKDVQEKYGAELTTVGAIGISAMMHGYMVFDKDGKLLAPFRTWRNTITEEASEKLTELFQFTIPQRWSIAHLYQCILEGKEHVKDIDYMTTLAGYIQWKLTGRKGLGVGAASGMFPIDSATGTYYADMVEKFEKLMEGKYPWKLLDIMPEVLSAGEDAGSLTPEGAALLDVSGKLQAGIPLCPPEGDVGTGMVATNSVAQRTGNVSAGTSIFAMVVLDRELRSTRPEVELVVGPDRSQVAMAHCNNCTSDLNAWMGLFKEFADTMGMDVNMGDLFVKMFRKAMEGDGDCGGLMAYNYFSGEPITKLDEGRPLFVRKPDSAFNLANFMRVNLYSALATLKIGEDILMKDEKVEVDRLTGHGGFFKTKGVGQNLMAAALHTPVTVMETAGEGGAWGIALLAAYRKDHREGESLADYLQNRVFAGQEGETVAPDPRDEAAIDAFIESYKACLAAERAAVETLK